jgi:hypothetical protein
MTDVNQSMWSAALQALRRKSILARAYKAALLTPDRQSPSNHGKTILADLRVFCRADVSCVVVSKDGHIDTHATAVAEGRREVWLRLMEHLHLDDQTIQAIGDDHHG